MLLQLSLGVRRRGNIGQSTSGTQLQGRQAGLHGQTDGKNSLGCSNTVTMTNYIHIFQPSISDFTALPGLETSIPNYTFKFLDASNRKPDKWHWSFGDGFTSEEQNQPYL